MIIVDNLAAATVKTFLADCLKAGVVFNGTDEDKWKAFKVKRTGREHSMNRRQRHQIYIRACENKSENAEGNKK